MGDTTTRGVTRTTRRLVLLATLTMLLAGCIKFDMDMTVSSDDTLSGTMVMAVDRSLMEMGGADGELSVEDMMADGGGAFDDDVEGVTAAPYDQDGFVGQQYTFEGVPLAVLNAESSDQPGDSLRIERDGDVFQVSGAFDMTESGAAGELGSATPQGDDLGEDLGLDPSVFFGGAELRIRLTFPGEVLESNGQIDGTSVTWDLDLGGANELSAVARADAGLATDTLLLYGLIGLAVLGAIVVIVLVRRGDKEIDAAAVSGAKAPQPIGAPLSAAEVAAREHAAQQPGTASPTRAAPSPATDPVPMGAGSTAGWSAPDAPAATPAPSPPAPAAGTPPPPPAPRRD